MANIMCLTHNNITVVATVISGHHFIARLSEQPLEMSGAAFSVKNKREYPSIEGTEIYVRWISRSVRYVEWCPLGESSGNGDSQQQYPAPFCQASGEGDIVLCRVNSERHSVHTCLVCS